MIAMTLAAFLIVSTLHLTNETAEATDAAAQTTRAYNAARQAMENVRSFRGATLANGAYDGLNFGDIPQLSGLGTNGSVLVQFDTVRPSVRRMTVTVRWNAGGPVRNKMITISSLFTKGGVTP